MSDALADAVVLLEDMQMRMGRTLLPECEQIVTFLIFGDQIHTRSSTRLGRLIIAHSWRAQSMMAGKAQKS